MSWRSNKRLRENERKLIDILKKIDSDYDRLFVIVEGKRDFQVLRSLGFKSPIIRTQSGKSRFELIESIAVQVENGPVLILTDFDDAGVEICQFIERELELRKVHVLKRLRREIRKAMGNWRCIEEFVSLFDRKDSPEPSEFQ